jgi:hypothetical protein
MINDFKNIQNKKTMRKLNIIYLLLFISTISFAQVTKKDTLKTEEINVVKPYTPTISDAFKVKDNPIIDATNSFQKETVNYSIFSIPVASTFTPSKGKAQGLVRAPKERYYENYVLAGFGNYMSPLFETFIHTGDQRYNDFGLLLNYRSSEGDIKDIALDNNFSNTKVDLYYKQFERDFNWKINAGYQRARYNYYGLPTNIVFDQNVIDAIDEKQVYNGYYIGGNINFDQSIFEGATTEIVGFMDYYNSNEIQFSAKPQFKYPLGTNNINGDVVINFLTGKFNQQYLNPNELKYSFLNIGVRPNYEILNNDLSVNIGGKLYYAFNIESSFSEFKFYPNVTASYKLVDDIFILTAGVTGDLIQNTYRDFTAENPFVSPTLNIQQTNHQYNAFVGAKGKLASNIGYLFNASYSSEKDKALFIQNQTLTNGTIVVNNAYEAGNSFEIVYDDIKSLNIYGEISLDISKEFQLEGSVTYTNYSTTNQLEAWNLPEIKANITANYRTKTWYAGAKLFFNGNTKDYVIPFGNLPQNGSIVTNNSYIDLNFNGGYIFTDRLSVFAKINNVVGDSYQRFVNYPVQSIQFLGGVMYKFDL